MECAGAKTENIQQNWFVPKHAYEWTWKWKKRIRIQNCLVWYQLVSTSLWIEAIILLYQTRKKLRGIKTRANIQHDFYFRKAKLFIQWPSFNRSEANKQMNWKKKRDTNTCTIQANDNNNWTIQNSTKDRTKNTSDIKWQSN